MKRGHGLALNEACMVMRCISHRACASHMSRFLGHHPKSL